MIVIYPVNQKLKKMYNYIKIFTKWLIMAMMTGILAGVVGSGFHMVVDYATHTREANKWIIYLLPVGGVVISFLYSLFKKTGKLDTNRVLEGAKGKSDIPLIMAPLIFVSTSITHLFGGSAGREGAALQLGGSIGYNVGKLFRFDRSSLRIIIMSGMGGVFAALFGTPVTAALFSVEVVVVGNMYYTALFPCVVSSLTAFFVAQGLGVLGVHFNVASYTTPDCVLLLKVIVVALFCAVVGMFFCISIKHTESLMERLFKNIYLRSVAGALIIIALTIAFDTTDYNGAGMNIIENAMNGVVKYEAFALKILFTCVTIAAGFKGGEIVPTFFIGSTFGCMMGALLGMDPSFGASLGFVAVFCSVTNCPVASFVLGVEVFGGDNLIFYAVACAVSYMTSGKYSLYSSQEFSCDKLA